MSRRRIARLAFALAGFLCAIPAGAATSSFDLADSKMTVFVYKQGLFSFMADNHEVDAPLANGSYDRVANLVELTIASARLKVLDPKLPADKRAQVQSAMSGPKVLDVERYPTIGFRSTKIDETDATHWKVTGDLTLHGQTHPVTVDVVKGDARHFTGSATIRQTQFGIAPIRIAGGAVSVRDDVKVEFAVALSS